MRPLNLLLVGLAVTVANTSNAQSKIFVKAAATGTHTGTSWATAYDDLSVAISAATAGDSIFVAAGTYKPSVIAGTSTDPRDKTFLLKDQVRVYGGFAGTEAKLADRDESKVLTTNATTLSGDIGLADSADNCYHVVTAINSSSSTLLNGVVITKGNANGTGSNTIAGNAISRGFGGGIQTYNAALVMDKMNVVFNYAYLGGAGMDNEGSSTLTVSNTTFYKNKINGTNNGIGGGAAMRNAGSNVTVNTVQFAYNSAYGSQGGGAVRNEASAAIFTDVTFDNNYSEEGDGGGAVYNASGSNSYFTRVNFTNNTTDNQGGAMYNDASSPRLTNVTFYKNTGNSETGAMENDGGSNAILNNVTFTQNTTPGNGGAMQNWTSSPILTDVTFDNNTAGGDGGAIYNYNTCSPTLNRVKIINNTAAGSGGGFYNKRKSHPIMTNTLIANNKAGNNGGGIYNMAKDATGIEPSSPVFTNMTLAGNIAGNSGGGAYDDGFGSSLLRNSIATGNYASVVADIDAPLSMVATALYRSIIGSEYYFTGLSTPTTFVADVFLDTLTADYRLAEFSPALNVGDSSYYAVGATPDISTAGISDIRNADRIMGLQIDLGAYEVCADTSLPTVSISPSTTTSVSVGATVVFTATIVGGGATPLYSWQKNGAAVGVYTSTYTAIAGTDFISGDSISCNILGSPLEACIGSDSVKSSKTKMLINVGIATVATNAPSLKIYPNPSKGTFKIETGIANDYSLQILDLSGRVVYSRSLGGATNTLSLAGNIPAGSYLLSIQHATMPKQVSRIVIQ